MSHSRLLWLWIPLALSTVLACSDDEDGNGTGGAGGNAGSGGSGGGGGGDGLSCETACAKIAATTCPKRPPNEQLCTALCNGILAGTNQQCAAAFRAMLACPDESATFRCAEDGNVTADGCEPEFAAVVPCLPPS
jgi:hypothetical protein